VNVRLDFDFHSGEPIYLQIAEHFRKEIALRHLRPGVRLPAIRSLARELNLDPGTVARAYRELEREGTIVSRRGGGSFVSAGAGEEHLTEERQRRLGLVVDRAILEALGLGLTAEDIETAFTLHLADWRERRAQPVKSKRASPSRQRKQIRFMGSHDLAVELLATHIATLYPDMHFATSFVGSLAGLAALECREADIAGAHLLDEESGQFNIPFVKRLMPNETVVLMNLVQRVQGLMLAPKNPKHILGIEDLTRPDITFVNRQSGSGTRILFDSRLLNLGIAAAQIKGYEHEEKTHTAVASLIGQGRADVGLGAQSAASAFGLDFIPLLKERYDLVALKAVFERPLLCKLQEAVCSDSFRHMLSSMPGYDITDTGKTVTVSPKSE
jgi:molybdate-binding protein/DNA-binding transcriptional regulator YhcF (GntR family)